MEKVYYLAKEQECNDTFNRLGSVFNAATPENHPIVFKTLEDFKATMTILAVCTKMFPGIRIFAFQLMSNHIHLVIGGNEEYIQEFFNYFTERLEKHFEGKVDLSGFKLKLFSIEDLSYFRNAIVYVNRNGFAVNDDVTPFSYPWGTSSFFFQPLAARYTKACGKPMGIQALREIMHTRNADKHKDILAVDGYVSPLEFCEMALAEKTFRDAKQYFYLISRKVEAYLNVARSLGEAIFYNDNDLYVAASKMARDNFGTDNLTTLSAKDKIDMARRLRFDYNAGDKQIQRLLKIEADILKAII